MIEKQNLYVGVLSAKDVISVKKKKHSRDKILL